MVWKHKVQNAKCFHSLHRISDNCNKYSGFGRILPTKALGSLAIIIKDHLVLRKKSKHYSLFLVRTYVPTE